MGIKTWVEARTAEGWLLFDGLEFDEGLRKVDVMSDLAFLTMDLKVHGRSDLAFALLNAYLDHTGDHVGVCLLLAEVYRAPVRLLLADSMRKLARLTFVKREQPA